MKESRSRKIFNVCNYIFMVTFGIITLYPFWYVLICSFNEGRDFTTGGVWLFPRALTLENYEMAFEDTRIYNSLLISISITVLAVVINLMANTMVSYALMVKTLPGKKAVTFFWYFTTLFGGGMIPYYLLLRRLGLNSSYLLYVIPGIYSFFNMVLIRANFNTIPYELRESAQLDGGSDWKILTRVYIPLSKPVLATVALFVAVGKWNDWFTAAYYQTNEKLYPAATVLKQIMANATANINAGNDSKKMQYMMEMSTTTPQSIQMAFVIILIMPIVIVYPFLQKYFVKGMLVGSVKG